MKQQTLLTRDLFREQVFQRDGHNCVICKKPGQDAHHIVERRLWDDGGYFLGNGATLCGPCHIRAEETTLSCREIREAAGIERIWLPGHLYADYEYDKWGNIENANGTRVKGELFNDESVQKILAQGGVLDRFSPYIKYPRTYHLPHSPGRTHDDKSLYDYSIFEGNEVVITEKLDGENTTFYWDGYSHARSLDSGNHPSRNWSKNRMSSVVYNLPEGWRICGENLYAKHSIHYKNLKSLFQVFSIWDNDNNCLSWSDTDEYTQLLEVDLAPVLYRGLYHNNLISDTLAKLQFRMNSDEVEGFVIRNAHQFSYGNFRRNVGKYVRAEHVVANTHWIKTAMIPNETTPWG